MTVEQVQRLLAMLKEREDVLERRITPLPAQDERYFRRRKEELKAFLNQAIDLDTPIDTSL